LLPLTEPGQKKRPAKETPSAQPPARKPEEHRGGSKAALPKGHADRGEKGEKRG
jgi:hypothetical protein